MFMFMFMVYRYGIPLWTILKVDTRQFANRCGCGAVPIGQTLMDMDWFRPTSIASSVVVAAIHTISNCFGIDVHISVSVSIGSTRTRPGSSIRIRTPLKKTIGCKRQRVFEFGRGRSFGHQLGLGMELGLDLYRSIGPLSFSLSNDASLGIVLVLVLGRR